jgi:hypothetical protein
MRWQAHPVAKIPHGYQVAVADVNGDGRLDILALSSEESIVEWYESPSWKPHPITTKTIGNISLAPLLGKGRGIPGLALATDFALEDSTRGGKVWWVDRMFTFDPEWRLMPIGQIPTSHRLRWADLEGNGRVKLVVAPILGQGAKPPDFQVGAPLSWIDWPNETFDTPSFYQRGGPDVAPPHLIDDSLTVVHGINVVDWEGDGRDEILTASFEGVHLFHSAGEGAGLRWTKVHLAAGDEAPKPAPAGDGPREVHRGSSEIGVGKVAGRRFLATIEPWHGDQVAVYFEAQPGPSDKLWSRRVIDSSFRDGHALACADLDGDGNDEIVAGFRGPGTSLYIYAANSSGAGWERQRLDTEMAASGVVIADLNGDGRLDIVAIGASTGNVKWYENLV